MKRSGRVTFSTVTASHSAIAASPSGSTRRLPRTVRRPENAANAGAERS